MINIHSKLLMAVGLRIIAIPIYGSLEIYCLFVLYNILNKHRYGFRAFKAFIRILLNWVHF